MIDLKFLQHLADFRTHTFEDVMQDIYLDYLYNEIQLYGFTCQFDTYGNLFCYRGKRNKMTPLIISHVDINQDYCYNPIKLLQHKDKLFAMDIEKMMQVGAGFDDKIGNYFALKYAADTENDVKIIFTKDEEAGCVGTTHLPPEWLNYITFAVQLDRRGASDISQFTNGVPTVSKQFKKWAAPVLSKFGYKWANTLCTDVGELKSYHGVNFCCVNISCGYYNEHTSYEFLNITEYLNAQQFTCELLNRCDGSLHYHKVSAPPLKIHKFFFNH